MIENTVARYSQSQVVLIGRTDNHDMHNLVDIGALGDHKIYVLVCYYGNTKRILATSWIPREAMLACNTWDTQHNASTDDDNYKAGCISREGRILAYAGNGSSAEVWGIS